MPVKSFPVWLLLELAVGFEMQGRFIQFLCVFVTLSEDTPWLRLKLS